MPSWQREELVKKQSAKNETQMYLLQQIAEKEEAKKRDEMLKKMEEEREQQKIISDLEIQKEKYRLEVEEAKKKQEESRIANENAAAKRNTDESSTKGYTAPPVPGKNQKFAHLREQNAAKSLEQPTSNNMHRSSSPPIPTLRNKGSEPLVLPQINKQERRNDIEEPRKEIIREAAPSRKPNTQNNQDVLLKLKEIQQSLLSEKQKVQGELKRIVTKPVTPITSSKQQKSDFPNSLLKYAQDDDDKFFVHTIERHRELPPLLKKNESTLRKQERELNDLRRVDYKSSNPSLFFDSMSEVASRPKVKQSGLFGDVISKFSKSSSTLNVDALDSLNEARLRNLNSLDNHSGSGDILNRFLRNS